MGARGENQLRMERTIARQEGEPQHRAASKRHHKGQEMPGKRVQFDEETWQALDLLARDQMKTFQELADEAFGDLLEKNNRPVSLKELYERALATAHRCISCIRGRRNTQNARTRAYIRHRVLASVPFGTN